MIPQELVDVLDSFGITEKLFVFVLCPAFQEIADPFQQQHGLFSSMTRLAISARPERANTAAARTRPKVSKKQ